MAKAAKSEKSQDTVSVLAFEKKLVPSDGFLFGTTWDRKQIASPLSLTEKSVRGTISNRLKPTTANDPLAINREVEKANLQTVDSCALGMDQDTLKHHFTLKILGGLDTPAACNNTSFRQTYREAVQGYISRIGMLELARRYVYNIASARHLWRNRVGAEAIEVHISTPGLDGATTKIFLAKDLPVGEFNTHNQQIDELAELVAQTLASTNDYLLLDVITYAKIGLAQEVYPSEELILDKEDVKDKSKKSKILYHVDNQAAMHSQKIGNAIRSIDTWYQDYSNPSKGVGAIAIEPYGSVTNLGDAFRQPSSKQDFYSYFDKWARGTALERIEDEHYVVAMLIRGGVFGKSAD